jgi:hypothetical protein
VSKYLAHERRLYREINSLRYYQNWCDTLEMVFERETDRKNTQQQPRAYFYTQIRTIELYHNR